MEHLILPEVRVDSPAVEEDHRPALAPLAVVETRAVAGFYEGSETRTVRRRAPRAGGGPSLHISRRHDPGARRAVQERLQDLTPVHDRSSLAPSGARGSEATAPMAACRLPPR